MDEEDNRYFILIDAIIDSRIILATPYNFVYDSGNITINGAKLPDSINKIYADKIQNSDLALKKTPNAFSLQNVKE